jgi:hypothetical protein
MSTAAPSTENIRVMIDLLAEGLDDLKAENADLRQRIDDIEQDISGKELGH